MKHFTIVLVLVLVTGIGVFLGYKQSTFVPSDTTLSEEELVIKTITGISPVFSHEGNPVFAIDSLSRYDEKWYVVTIRSIHETKATVPVYFLFARTNDTLQTILGPDTRFSESEMLHYNVPDSIIREFSSL